MVTKTPLNGQPDSTSFTSSAVHMIRDAVELIELVVKLFVADVQAAKRRLVVGVAMAVAAIVVALAALPLLMAAAAWALVELFEWSTAAAFATIGMVAATASAIAIYVAWKRLRTCASVFSRSRDELYASARCVRSAVRTVVHSRTD